MNKNILLLYKAFEVQEIIIFAKSFSLLEQ